MENDEIRATKETSDLEYKSRFLSILKEQETYKKHIEYKLEATNLIVEMSRAMVELSDFCKFSEHPALGSYVKMTLTKVSDFLRLGV